eukprot:TRINITY_DN34396_c0_g1_i1.p1 TRINITY_DN34396_c0_g1~~TRINITY_DN34396_c0_g1_i1.p1  ORF type:complete len:216 (+),score=31.14 TRINITY_DN34396_c0_g1_i1:85-732(+)
MSGHGIGGNGGANHPNPVGNAVMGFNQFNHNANSIGYDLLRGWHGKSMSSGEMRDEVGKIMSTVQRRMEERTNTLMMMQMKLGQLRATRENDGIEYTNSMLRLRNTIMRLNEMVQNAEQGIPGGHNVQFAAPTEPQQPQPQPQPAPQQQQQQIPPQQPSQAPSSMDFCFSCGKAAAGGNALLLCGGCRIVAFCNRECQLESWPTHRLTCRPRPAQ